MPAETICIAHGETVQLLGRKCRVMIENTRHGAGPVLRTANLEFLDEDAAADGPALVRFDDVPPPENAGELVLSIAGD